MRNEVARNGDKIRLKLVGQLNDSIEGFGGKVDAMMYVRKMDNAEAAKGLGQIFEDHPMFGQLKRSMYAQSPHLEDSLGLPERLLLDATIPPSAG